MANGGIPQVDAIGWVFVPGPCTYRLRDGRDYGRLPSSRALASDLGVSRSVTEQAYVYKQPTKIVDGTVFKGNTIKVEKLSKNGKYAYGLVYGHVNRHAWVDASVLTAKK